MKSKILLFSILVFLSNAIKAQSPDIEWEKCFGGTGTDQASSVIRTTDGGYAIAGYTSSSDGDVTVNHGMYDYWIVQIDCVGNIIWQKTFGGSNNDEATTIVQTSDGGYVVSGGSISNDGDVTGHHGGSDHDDMWVIKLDGSGNLQWEKSLGGTENESANSIIQTTDGGFAVAGSSASTNGDATSNFGIEDYWIVKLNSSADIQWQKSFGGSLDDRAQSIIQTSDGGYAVAGSSNSSDHDVTGNHSSSTEDYWIMKLDDEGSIQWQKCLGGSDPDLAYSIVQTSEGGYVIAGGAQSNDGDVTGNHGKAAYWIVKLNVDGNLVWEKSIGGFENDAAYSIIQTTDGSYAVAGESETFSIHDNGYFPSDYYVVKLDAAGNLIWSKAMGGYDNDDAYSITGSSDEGYVISGVETSFDGGDVTNSHGGSDYWIVKLHSDVTGINNPYLTSSIKIFPDPSSGIFQISLPELSTSHKLKILNELGIQIFNSDNSFYNLNRIDLSSQPPGIYLLHLETDKGIISEKLVISR